MHASFESPLMLSDPYTSIRVHHGLVSTAALQQMIVRLSITNSSCAVDTTVHETSKSKAKLTSTSTPASHSINPAKYNRLSQGVKTEHKVLLQHTLPAQRFWQRRHPKTMSASCPSVWQKQ